MLSQAKGAGSPGKQGSGGHEKQEKKGRKEGSLRWREACEKFKKANFRYLLLLIIQSKKRTQQCFLTFLTFSEAYGKILSQKQSENKNSYLG